MVDALSEIPRVPLGKEDSAPTISVKSLDARLLGVRNSTALSRSSLEEVIRLSSEGSKQEVMEDVMLL